MGERRSAHWALVGKLERKGALGRPRHRWEDNTKWMWSPGLDRDGSG